MHVVVLSVNQHSTQKSKRKRPNVTAEFCLCQGIKLFGSDWLRKIFSDKTNSRRNLTTAIVFNRLWFTNVLLKFKIIYRIINTKKCILVFEKVLCKVLCIQSTWGVHLSEALLVCFIQIEVFRLHWLQNESLQDSRRDVGVRSLTAESFFSSVQKYLYSVLREMKPRERNQTRKRSNRKRFTTSFRVYRI